MTTQIRCRHKMSTVSTVVAVCLAVFLGVDMSLAYTTRNEIKLVNNGYEDILVAIGESVPVSESGNMIRRIKVRALSTVFTFIA